MGEELERSDTESDETLEYMEEIGSVVFHYI